MKMSLKKQYNHHFQNAVTNDQGFTGCRTGTPESENSGVFSLSGVRIRGFKFGLIIRILWPDIIEISLL